jgi:hypothetical protein
LNNGRMGAWIPNGRRRKPRRCWQRGASWRGEAGATRERGGSRERIHQSGSAATRGRHEVAPRTICGSSASGAPRWARTRGWRCGRWGRGEEYTIPGESSDKEPVRLPSEPQTRTRRWNLARYPKAKIASLLILPSRSTRYFRTRRWSGESRRGASRGCAGTPTPRVGFRRDYLLSSVSHRAKPEATNLTWQG